MAEQSRIVSSQEVGAELIQQLGLPKHCRRVEIVFDVDKVVAIKAEFHADERIKGFIQWLGANYELIPKQNRAPDDPGLVDTTALKSCSREFALEIDATPSKLSEISADVKAIHAALAFSHK